MPNIIEQQDLLKGLPDNRLAMMMQNPSGDIPPFLVAAEAQRRQAIRAQFSGGPQESVVDTLTKQMANVPQNIQAPAQMPPRMPPPQMPPQAAGVAALQQGMRDGGMVQRYQDKGLVAPSLYGPAGSPAEQMAKTYMLLNPGMTYEEAIQRASIGQPIAAPTVGEVAAAQASKIGEGMGGVGNYSILRGDQSAPATSPIIEQSAGVSSSSQSGKFSGYDPLTSIIAPSNKPKTASPATDPRDPSAGKNETSTGNQAKTDMTVDEYKKYLEDIYGVKAEDSEYIRNKIKELYSSEDNSFLGDSAKWFAAAQAIMQPGQNTNQAIINAISAVGSGYAEERAAERANKRDMEEALLKQDIADRQAAGQSERDIAKAVLDFRLSQEERDRATDSATSERQIESLKWQSQQATEDAKVYQNESADATAELNRHISNMVSRGALDADISKDPTVISLTNKIKDLNDKANKAMIRSRWFRQAYGSATGASVNKIEYADGDTMGYLD